MIRRSAGDCRTQGPTGLVKRSRAVTAAAIAALVVLAMLLAAGTAGATVTEGAVNEGFGDETVFEGLAAPTNVKFAPDGRIFVAEKSGKILVFDSLHDKTPKLFANLAKPVYDYEDHGLLGIALDPMFDLGRPYIYAIYTFNHQLADKATQTPQVTDPNAITPAWSSPDASYEHDQCPENEKYKRGEVTKEALGCEVSGLVVRMEVKSGSDEAVPSAAAPAQKVLIEGWCQQSTTHSIGDLGFGPEGDLFVSGGEGSMFSEPDYGQYGNPCGDPLGAEGPNGTHPNALGGSLRAQSALRSGGPTLLSGTVLRVNPDTGLGVAGNPFAASPEPNKQRIIGIGFRQPWRFTFNPRSNQLFVANVGDGTYEEIDRLPLDGAATYSDGEPAYNSGWPCYEGGPTGPRHNEHYAFASQPLPTLKYCIDQYKAEEEGKVETSTPFFSYLHTQPVAPDDPCGHTLTDIGGISFYEGDNYPAEYKNALFFSDPIRGCIYVMKAGAGGEPDTTKISTIVSTSESFVFPGIDVEQGPEGDIFYTEFGPHSNGAVHRITHAPPEPPPPPPGEPEPETPGGPNPETPTTPQPETGTTSTSPPVTGGPATGSPAGNPPAVTYAPTAVAVRPKLRRHPSRRTTARTARFAFGATPGTKFRCRLDGEEFAPCHSPRTYNHLKPGSHAFRVYAVDASGSRAGAATKFAWRVLAAG